MDEENETVEGVVLDDGSSETLVLDLPSDENAGEHNSESEPPKSDAVAIAEIQAETTIAVTAIEADVEQARIEADAERNRNWDAEREALQTSITELTNQIAGLETQLSQALPSPLNPTPQPDLEEAAELAAEVVAEAIAPDTSLTPPSTPESETVTEPGQEGVAESVEAVAVALAVPARRRRRLI